MYALTTSVGGWGAVTNLALMHKSMQPLALGGRFCWVVLALTTSWGWGTVTSWGEWLGLRKPLDNLGCYIGVGRFDKLVGRIARVGNLNHLAGLCEDFVEDVG